MITKTEIIFGHLVEHHDTGEARVHARQINELWVDSKKVRHVLCRHYAGLSARARQKKCRNDTGVIPFRDEKMARTKARNAELVSRFDADASVGDLAELFGLCRTYTKQIIGPDRIAADLKAQRSKNEAQIAERLKLGQSRSAIAKAMGISCSTIYAALRPAVKRPAPARARVNKKQALADSAKSLSAAWAQPTTLESAK